MAHAGEGVIAAKPSDKTKPLKKQYSVSLEKRIEHAKEFVKEHSFKKESQFIRTEAYDVGNNFFQKAMCLGVIGGPKTGKSTLIAQIMHNFLIANGEKYEIVFVSLHGQLDEIRSELKKRKNTDDKTCVLIIDNMFAMHKYTSEIGENWLRELEALNSSIATRKLGIVFTMNALVYNKCKATFSTKPFFKNIIQVYDQKYLMDEDFKRRLLEAKYKKVRNDSVTKFIKDASKESSNFGFLFWCKTLKVTDFRGIYKQSLDAVERYTGEMLSVLEREQEVLFLVLFMDGELDVTLQDSETSIRFDKLCRVFSGFKGIEPRDFCEIFEGTFLKSNKNFPNKYSFVEPVVECVTLKRAFNKYGKLALEWCSLDSIMKLISIGGLKIESLSKDDLMVIARSIRNQILKIHRTVNVVLEYRCLRYGSFLKLILPEFNKPQRNVLAKRLTPKICEDGDIECLLYAMQYLEDFDEPVDERGRSPFQVTICSDHNDDDAVNRKLEVLILNKWNYMSIDRQGSNVFHLLTEKRGLHCLKFLLKFDELKELIDDDPDSNGRTPLHIACIEQKYEAVEFFLNNCGDKKGYVNKRDNKDRTALHYAVEYMDYAEQLKIIEILLKSGAKTDIEDIEKKIPLHEIRHCSCCVSQVVELLLAGRKRDVDHQDKFGFTPLHLATKAGNVEAVKVLLSEGADVTIEDDEDVMTALMFACQECVANSSTILKLLLDANSNIDSFNRFGLTALQEAAAEGNIPCVKELLKYGADPNKLSQNEQEETAVHIILRRPDLEAFEMIKIMLEHHADISIRDSEGKTVKERVSPELLLKIEEQINTSFV